MYEDSIIFNATKSKTAFNLAKCVDEATLGYDYEVMAITPLYEDCNFIP